eukprot:3339740-Amphidinium_carterae.1
MDGSGNTERDRHLAAVRNGSSLEDVPEHCRADCDILLAAVQVNGLALRHAAEECKRDREIVLAAVQQTGHALQYAAAECKADRAIVLAAVQSTPTWALYHASPELLLDSTFAPETKEDWYILKIFMLPGRSTAVLSGGHNS